MVTEQVPINNKNFPCRAVRQPPWARHHSWSPAPLQSPELRPGPGRSARLHPQVSGGLVYFVMQTVDSCVATLFVCFVEDPAALSVTAPEAYTILSTAWAQRYPEFSQARAHGAF